MSELQNENTVALTTEEKIEKLASSLAKSTTTVKKDRAVEISELIEVELKRKVEDLERLRNSLQRKKRSALDLSPDNTFTIMKVKDFDPTEFVDNYIDLQLKIREEKVKLNAAKESYNEIFGETFDLENIK